MEPFQAQHEDMKKGILYALFGFFCMAVYSVCAKLATVRPGCTLTINFIVYSVGTLLLIPYICRQGISFLKTEHFGLHFMRASFGVSAAILFLAAIQEISLVNAMTLFNTSPIFIPILGIFLLNSPVTKRNWLAIVIGFLGIVAIVRPTRDIVDQVGDLVGLLSGIFLAIAYISIKKLTPTEPTMRIVFYFFLLATLLQLPFLPFYGAKIDIVSITWAVLASISFVVAQVTIVKAYRYAKASKVGFFQYSSVIFSGLFDCAIWNVQPTILELLGVVLIVSSGTLITTSQQN